MDIVIVGSGNVATVLGRKAFAAGHRIVQVVSRNPDHAKSLAAELNATHGEFASIDRSALIYIVAISDQALISFDRVLHLDKAVVVHTGGSVSKQVLNKVSLNYGVLWPLQSLRKEAINIPDFPLIVDANTAECMTILQDFAGSISSKVTVMDDVERRKMHLAAVIAGNFTNHLLSLVNQYCKAENIDMSLLQPILHETVSRLSYADPASMQTGPAIRNDIETMNQHMEMLAHNEELREVYDLFSSLIIHAHHS